MSRPRVYVASLKLNTAGRVDAEVVLGATKVQVTVPANDPVMAGVLGRLQDAVVDMAVESLSHQLGIDFPLEPVTDSSST